MLGWSQPEGRHHRVAALILVGACLVAYAGSPFNGFVADDHAVIEHNPIVTTPGRGLEAFTTPYRGVVYRPLTVWTFALQWQAHGGVPAAFHLVNVLLHAVMTVLVFCLIQAVARPGLGPSLLASLVFAVHTIHTDAVSAIVGRADLLAATSSVAAFLCWRRWVLMGGWLYLAATGFLFFSGLLAKESAGPFLVFAIAWVLLARLPIGEKPLFRDRDSRRRALWGTVLGLVVPLVAYGFARVSVLGMAPTPAWSSYFGSVDGWTTLWSLFGIWARYLWLLLVPYPLSPDYTWEAIPLATSPAQPWTLAGLLTLPALLVLTARLLASRTFVAAGLGLVWFFVFMLPATHMIPLMIPMAERMTYLPSAGLCVGLAVALDRAARYRFIATYLAASGYIALLLGMTLDRDRVWRDDLTLWSDAVATHPKSAISLMNLAGALVPAGEVGKAVGAMQRAVEVAPWRWDFRVTLADLLHEIGRHEDEARVLLEGMRTGRGDPVRTCQALSEVRKDISPDACLRELDLQSAGPPSPRL